MNVTDPSSHRVLEDPRQFSLLEHDLLQTVETSGILAAIVIVDKDGRAVVDMLNLEKPFLWEGWEEPQYRTRLKKSYEIVKEFFATL